MKIKYLGHSAFELTLEGGRRIVFDPYDAGAYGGALAYGPIEGEYDLAVVSHGHADHRCEPVVAKARDVVDGEGEFEFEGVSIKAIPVFHDESGGSERGGNLISILKAEGLSVAHLGDLGHNVTAEEAPDLKGVDVLLVPVGGYFTIDAAAAAALVAEIEPKVVIPMHFKTDKVDFPIGPVDEFTDIMEKVERTGASEVEITKDSLAGGRRVVVLEPAN